MLSIFLYLFIGVIVIQLCFYLGVFGKFVFDKPKKNSSNNVSVSVLVCAKNEAMNVEKYLPLLAEQDYPNYEIVLIDDASTDETLELFEQFEKKYNNIRIVKVKNTEVFWGNKKYALTLGIKAAKNDYLLMTNADCYPTSKDWIRSMAATFTDEKTIVLGYNQLEKSKSFVNKIIRFENLFSTVSAFSWALAKHPYTGSGKNFGYKKEEFFNVNGFVNHIKIRIGDDALFINETATSKNTTIVYSPESFTGSIPKNTFNDFYNQKRRQVKIATYFKSFDKIQLLFFNITQLLSIVLGLILIISQTEWIIVTSLLSLRYIVSWIIMGLSAKKLKENDLTIWYPIIEIVLIFTQIKASINNLYSKPVHWK